MARVESPQPDPLRSLAAGAAGGSPCPKADFRPEWQPSNSLRAAPFDNTERRLDGRERYVVGHYRLG